MARSVVAEKMEAARRLGQVIAERNPGVDAVYLAGSLTAGLGNPTSDADLFVLCEADADEEDFPTQYSVDGHRVDVERFTVARARRTVEDVASFRLHRDRLTDLHKLADPLDFVFRLRSSETVVNSPGLEALRRQVDTSLPAIQRTAVNYAAIAINGALEDFLGAAVEGDFDTAAYAGQRLTAHAGKAVVLASGDLYFSNKWVYKQLHRLGLKNFPMDAFTSYQRGSWAEGGTEQAEALIFFAQTWIAVAQLLGSANVPIDTWPVQPEDSAPAAHGFWRNPSYNVLTVDTGILLHWELRRQLVLKEHIAFIWALCDGRTQEDITAAITSLAAHVPTLAPLDDARIGAILDALEAKSLVSTTPYSALAAV